MNSPPNTTHEYEPSMECPYCEERPCMDPMHLERTARYWFRVAEEWAGRTGHWQNEYSGQEAKRLAAEAELERAKVEWEQEELAVLNCINLYGDETLHKALDDIGWVPRTARGQREGGNDG